MTAFPIYILADRSGSMVVPADAGTAIDVVNRVIREILGVLSRDPTICMMARISVLSFADDATIDLPLTQPSATTMCPALYAGGRTSFAAAFETTARAISADVTRLVQAQDPMVFMLTDGKPNADRDARRGWTAEYRALLGSAGAGRGIRVVPFGFGKINAEVLRSIASDPTAAYIAARDVSPSQAIIRFAELIIGSVTSSVAHGEPQTVAPSGSRVLADDEDT